MFGVTEIKALAFSPGVTGFKSLERCILFWGGEERFFLLWTAGSFSFGLDFFSNWVRGRLGEHATREGSFFLIAGR